MKGQQKTFADALKERVDAKTLLRLDKAFTLETESFEHLRNEVSEAVLTYMQENSIGPRKMAAMLCCSDPQLIRITSGKHGLTLATIAHIGAAIGYKPRIIFEEV